MELLLGLDLVRFLSEHRHPALTAIAQLFTFLGEIEGYVLLVALVYVAHDKRLAVRLAVLTLLAMSLNHVLKTFIRNPRPFADGPWAERWAVSPAKAADLVTEFSTPSGHGMAAGAFCTYLHQSVRSSAVRAASLALLVLTGLSRPYLGVHYLEDVLLGWLIGGAMAFVALRHAARIGTLWRRLGYGGQVALTVAASAASWLATRAVSDWSASGQPTAFLSYAGFLAGIVIGHPIEVDRVRFDPQASTLPRKAASYVLVVASVLGTLELLDAAFAPLAADASPLGDLFRFVRYAFAGLSATLLAPLLCVTLGLAGRSDPWPPLGPPPVSPSPARDGRARRW
jgi:membrane-associated phospholipid phosphatase